MKTRMETVSSKCLTKPKRLFMILSTCRFLLLLKTSRIEGMDKKNLGLDLTLGEGISLLKEESLLFKKIVYIY